MNSPARQRIWRRAPHGFTLMEVLLAVTILSLVMTVVYSTWHTAFAAWKRGQDTMETFQRQRVVMETLAELVKSIVFYGSQSELYQIIGEHQPGLGDSISFVTASDVSLPPGDTLAAGMRRVKLFMARDQSGAPVLAISNQPALEPEETDYTPAAHVLSTEVSGFFVRYRDPRDGVWREKWAEPTVVPAAVEFTLVFGHERGRVPPVVVTRAIEIPMAQYATQTSGQFYNQQSTTNEVRRRDVNLSELAQTTLGESGE
jgi:prepilin-type N-terminal cleavage/methylation domain-containing protein